jgi:hypothetical protein
MGEDAALEEWTMGARSVARNTNLVVKAANQA